MKRDCLKCGHSNEAATGGELEACPNCGAIYSRVAAAAARMGAPAQPGQSAAAAVRARRPVSTDDFVESMRESSIYPTFRQVVNLFAMLGYVLAVLVALGSLFALVKVNVGAGLIGIAFALFIFIMTRMGKEMSLMLADASDALVRLAARQD